MIRRYDLTRSDNYVDTDKISYVCSGSGTYNVITGFPVKSALVTFSTLPIIITEESMSSSSESSNSLDSSSSSSSYSSSSSSSSCGKDLVLIDTIGAYDTRSIDNDGTYIYRTLYDTDDDKYYLKVYYSTDVPNEVSLGERASLEITGGILGVHCHDGVIYVGKAGAGIEGYTFDDGTNTFTKVAKNQKGYYFAHDSNYIYVACNDEGVRAYVYDPTESSSSNSADDYFGLLEVGWTGYAVATKIWCDGTYIYTNGGGITAYTFDGATFTKVGQIAFANTVNWIWGDGTYIYAAWDGIDSVGGISALTFTEADSSSSDSATADYGFTLLDNKDTGYGGLGQGMGVWGDGEYIYVADSYTGLSVYTFNGTNLTFVNNTNNGQSSCCVTGVNGYIYLGNAGANFLREYRWENCDDGCCRILIYSGATEDTAVNGTYYPAGYYNGKPYWSNGSRFIFSRAIDDLWSIADSFTPSGYQYYYLENSEWFPCPDSVTSYLCAVGDFEDGTLTCVEQYSDSSDSTESFDSSQSQIISGLPRLYVSGYLSNGFIVAYENIPEEVGYIEFSYSAS
jgi:hypothetical protein